MFASYHLHSIPDTCECTLSCHRPIVVFTRGGRGVGGWDHRLKWDLIFWNFSHLAVNHQDIICAASDSTT